MMDPHADANWKAALVWHYGFVRAGEIVLGLDAKTNADLAAWRRLGGKTATSLDARFDQAVKLVKQGHSVEDAAFLADVLPMNLQKVLRHMERS